MSQTEKLITQIWLDVLAELDRAEAKHPSWPEDLIHGAAIVVEEAAEALTAAFDHTYAGGHIDDIEEELVQTAAMAVRMLYNMRK